MAPNNLAIATFDGNSGLGKVKTFILFSRMSHAYWYVKLTSPDSKYVELVFQFSILVSFKDAVLKFFFNCI